MDFRKLTPDEILSKTRDTLSKVREQHEQMKRQFDTNRLNSIKDSLRELYPYGHPDFIPRLLNIAQLHSDKNHDYALGGSPLGNFDRTAAIMQLYPKFPWSTNFGFAVVQMLKQLDAFMWQAQDPTFTPKVEGGDARLRDIAVFAQLIAIMLQDSSKG